MRNEIEFRAAETLDVRWPERVITVLAMPYERPTSRVVHRGRQITEIVSQGAFAGVEHRHRVNVLREHDAHRPVGYTTALDADRTDGLLAELRISRTALGDETLELAADGILAASVGFAPMVRGERWSNDRTQRRLDKCYLDHIGLVVDPAYDGTEAVAVRAAAVTDTPNLDRVRALLAELGVQLTS